MTLDSPGLNQGRAELNGTDQNSDPGGRSWRKGVGSLMASTPVLSLQGGEDALFSSGSFVN